MNSEKHTEANIKKWNKWAPEADGKGLKYVYLRKVQESLISILALRENINFLDIGCGTGWAVGKSAEAVNWKGEFYGVDLSPKMIEKARENFKDRNNFHFIEASSESIPLDGDLFDIIICTNSFHHYLHPEKAMNEIHRLLKNDGRMYILDPTADSLFMKIIDKINKWVDPAHVKMYSTKEFRAFLKNADLIYIESKVIRGEKVHIGEKRAL